MWFESCTDVLVQFIEARGILDERARTVLSIALLAQKDDQRLLDQIDLLGPASTTLDTPLLLDVLQTANPPQIASVLWSPVGLYFSADQFKRLFRIVLAASPGDDTIYELLGGAFDFLRFHPGEFSIPLDIVLRLMESPSADSRIVGLKALIHTPVSLAEHVDYLMRFFQSTNESDKEIGIFSLGQLLDKYGHRVFESVHLEKINSFHQFLHAFAEDIDKPKSGAARRYLEALNEWMGEGKAGEERGTGEEKT